MNKNVGRLPESIEVLDAAFEKRVWLTLQHYGINFMGEVYSAPELANIRRYQGKKKDDRKVQVAIDRDNLGSVVVICPFTGERYRAACTSRNDLEGVSTYAYKRANKYAKEHGISKARAMNELREIGEQIIKKGKVKKRRKPVFKNPDGGAVTLRQSLAGAPNDGNVPQKPRKNTKRTNLVDQLSKRQEND